MPLSPAGPPPIATSAVAQVTAVVVTYHPEPAALQQLLTRLAAQVGAVLVVDNSPSQCPLPGDAPGLTVLRQHANIGLAAAQNLGLQHAQRQGAAFALLLDQDSLPAEDMTQRLLQVHADAGAQGLRVGAVGALVVDPQGLVEGFVRFDQGRYAAVLPQDSEPWVSCQMLIASGTLIPMAALQAVGPMDEALFIDRIDFEWCLRALARGFVLLGARDARLHHHLGEHHLRLWFGQWRDLPVHKPFRYYYMVRNSLRLRRLPHATPEWRRADRRQLLSLLLYFGLLAPGRWAALRMMARGLWAGLRGMGGPLR